MKTLNRIFTQWFVLMISIFSLPVNIVITWVIINDKWANWINKEIKELNKEYDKI